MKLQTLCLCLLISLYSCAPYTRTVRREATCKFMAEHPLKDTINNDVRHSYVVYFHAGLYPDEMIKCNCQTAKK